MILYLSVIVVCMAIIVTCNHFFYAPALDLSLGFNILGVVLTTVLIIAIDGLVAFIAHTLQKKYDPFSRYFSVSQKEKRFYEKIGVKRFKDWLPDLGSIVNFKKGKIEDPNNKDYIYLYMKESCSGEIGHLAGMVFGFLTVFCAPLRYFLCFGIPVSIVNFILSFLPVIALRYNRYKLSVVYRMLEKRALRAAAAAEKDGSMSE